MQTRLIRQIFISVAIFIAGLFCGRYFFDHIDTVESLRKDAVHIDYEFGDSGGDQNIPRSMIVEALSDYLKLLAKNPKDEDAYLGAVDCYMRLGASQEAANIRDQAKSYGIGTRSLDNLILAYGIHKHKAR